MDNNKDCFHIGLCMAGAVSAGAYTAGVIDYLLEALDEWEKRRGQPGVPTHQVKISVIGGASAGGMTGIVTASAINNPIKPVNEFPDNLLKERPDNPLYHSWVDLLQDDMFSSMLATDDIKPLKVYSLLNSSFIDIVADSIGKVDPDLWIERPYVSSGLKLFTTLTNLRGFPYNIPFNGNASSVSKYFISVHNDFACFEMNKPVATPDQTGWMPLDFIKNVNVTAAKQAAMATGAFPVGLKARKFLRTPEVVNYNHWYKDIFQEFPVMGTPKDSDNYETLNIDGGLINNEPFEKVRDILNTLAGEDKESESFQQFETFGSTVILIDPFPSEHAPDVQLSDEVLPVIGKTLSAMISQLRVKPANLKNALNPSKAGQWLIAPKRDIPLLNGGKKEDVQGYKAIACGAVEGFSGFMNKEFRVHDFYLGRANCEKFLRDHFTVPADTSNPIFKEGYSEVADTAPYTSALKQDMLQIIPVYTKKYDHLPMPVFSGGINWPVIRVEKIDHFRDKINKRIHAVIMNIAKLSFTHRALLWLGAKVWLDKRLTDAALHSIRSSLTKHELLKV